MLHQDDLKWIAKTSTELNTVLQQIARYADLAKRQKGDHDYIDQLNQQVEIATQAAQALLNRVMSMILESTSGKTPSPGVRTATSSAPGAKLAGEEVSTEARAPRITPEIPVLNPEGARELVLIVDDEPEIAEFASTILAEEGYKVIIARDGFEALKIFQQIHHEIGLIILDFFLPVMDGDAVFEELKAINPGVDVVLSSGFAEQNKIGAMLAQGLRGFIPKPYTREKLLQQIRSTLDAPRRPSRLRACPTTRRRRSSGPQPSVAPSRHPPTRGRRPHAVGWSASTIPAATPGAVRRLLCRLNTARPRTSAPRLSSHSLNWSSVERGANPHVQ